MMHTRKPNRTEQERAELRARLAGLLVASDAYEFEPTCERERRAEALADVLADALASDQTR